MFLTITKSYIDLPLGGEVVLRHQTWSDYEALLTSRGDNAAIKIRFNAKQQEIELMSPLPGHGRRVDSLADFVKILLRRQGRDWDSSHPVTLKCFQQAGLEPDACFYIQNRQAILGKDRLDLAVDPPPDLVLEMDLTATTHIEDYQAIAIPEVWIYRRQALKIYCWDGKAYQEQQVSPTLPDIDVKQLLPAYVERAWQAGSSVALREFEQALADLR